MIPIDDYPIIIFWGFTLLLPFLVAFIVWIIKTLNKQTTALAVLISETRPTLKLVNEVIDLKVASAELNEGMKRNTENIKTLFSYFDDTRNGKTT